SSLFPYFPRIFFLSKGFEWFERVGWGIALLLVWNIDVTANELFISQKTPSNYCVDTLMTTAGTRMLNFINRRVLRLSFLLTYRFLFVSLQAYSNTLIAIRNYEDER
ncbi:MAG: hypothetical protein K5683_06240, partial [Prevotella sp.]|nr:hypothetical protein [Prevotella sp.]